MKGRGKKGEGQRWVTLELTARPIAGGESAYSTHPAALRTRGINSAFLPEWSAHTAAEPSDRGRD